MQNDKFAILLQYLKKKVSNEVDFVRADKDENLLQIDRMTLMGMAKHPQSSQNSKFAMSLQYRQKKKKKLLIKLIFCMQINIIVSYKLISRFGRQSFLQGDTVTIDGHDQAFSKDLR